MTDTQPAAQVAGELREMVRQWGKPAHTLSGYNACQLMTKAAVTLEAAQREIAELKAERDRAVRSEQVAWSKCAAGRFVNGRAVYSRSQADLDAAFAQGSEVTVDADGRMTLVDEDRRQGHFPSHGRVFQTKG